METGKFIKSQRSVPNMVPNGETGLLAVGSLKFPNGFSGKLLFHVTFNSNFRVFLLNGKHPREHPFFERALGSTETLRTTHRRDWVRIKGKNTNKLHSGFKLKMAAFQFLLRRARNFDTILHRSSLFGNKIACNIRCISQGKIYDFKLEPKMFGKVGFTTRLYD